MEPFVIYGIKSAAILALFYLLYILVLQKETFFNTNRWFLLFGLLASVILPMTTFVKTVWIETQVAAHFSTTAANHESIKADVERLSSPILIEQPPIVIDWFLICLVIYCTVVLALFLKFLAELYVIRQLFHLKQATKYNNCNLVATDKKIAPFSFFNWIVVHANSHSTDELEDILAHEQIHCQQLHSIDVIISRLFSIIFWFNPFVWLYKNAIVQNLEFIADFGAIKIVADKKNYQFTLLKVTTHQNCVAISNHFYQPCLLAGRSLIKKRIVMLNKNQSKIWQSWKYVIVFPILVAFVFQFQMKVVAQEKEAVSRNSSISTVKITKKSTDLELKEDCERVKKANNVDLKFDNIKRNSTGDITNISASFDDNRGSKSKYNQKKSTAIDDFYFGYEKSNDGKVEIGFKENLDFEKIGSFKVPNPPMPPMPPLPTRPPSIDDYEKYKTKRTIFIDVSHGGSDFGATVNDFKEKEIVANIANKIKELGENSNVDIILTRTDDSFVSLQDRVDQINKINPSLVLSLHVNANTDTSKSGFEIYLNSKSSFYNEAYKKSSRLLFIVSRGNPVVILNMKNAGFMISRNSNCPVIHLEMGFITNEKDRNYITSNTGQNEIANNIIRFLKE